MKHPEDQQRTAFHGHDHEYSMLDMIQAFREQGYSEDLNAEDHGIRAMKADMLFDATDLAIDHVEHFEGMSNPADSSELFAISGPNGMKGILISAYGAKHSQGEEQLRKLNWSKRNQTINKR